MDSVIGSRPSQYLIVFVATGLIAVGVKYLGDLGEGRLAGLIAMLPIKILAAWVILALELGSEGIQSSVTGMLIGLVAIAGMLLVVWIVGADASPFALIASGVTAWMVLAAVLLVPWNDIIGGGI